MYTVCIFERTNAGSTPGLSFTKVFRKMLNQLSALDISSGDTCIGIRKSNFTDEFWGVFFATAVTRYGSKVSPFLICNVFPDALVLPKYFLAASSDSTIDLGSFSAVFGFPSIKGKLKKVKKLLSAYNISSEKISVPFLKSRPSC